MTDRRESFAQEEQATRRPSIAATLNQPLTPKPSPPSYKPTTFDVAQIEDNFDRARLGGLTYSLRTVHPTRRHSESFFGSPVRHIILCLATGARPLSVGPICDALQQSDVRDPRSRRWCAVGDDLRRRCGVLRSRARDRNEDTSATFSATTSIGSDTHSRPSFHHQSVIIPSLLDRSSQEACALLCSPSEIGDLLDGKQATKVGTGGVRLSLPSTPPPPKPRAPEEMGNTCWLIVKISLIECVVCSRGM